MGCHLLWHIGTLLHHQGCRVHWSSGYRGKAQVEAEILSSHRFISLAVETQEVIGSEGHSFLEDIARCITAITDEPLAYKMFLQHIAVAMQRGIAHPFLGQLRKRVSLFGLPSLPVHFYILFFFLSALYIYFCIAYSCINKYMYIKLYWCCICCLIITYPHFYILFK